jgi:hypothetical protein
MLACVLAVFSRIYIDALALVEFAGCRDLSARAGNFSIDDRSDDTLSIIAAVFASLIDHACARTDLSRRECRRG